MRSIGRLRAVMAFDDDFLHIKDVEVGRFLGEVIDGEQREYFDLC